MSVEIDFPVEFVVEGVPLSLGASTESRERWKARVAAAASETMPEGHWASQSPIRVTICYFPDGRMVGDLDNILKPILDALVHLVYIDDRQVERILVQKFEPDRAFSFDDPSPRLIEASVDARPRVYVRIDADAGTGEG